MNSTADAGTAAGPGTTVVVGQLFRVRRGKKKQFVAEQQSKPGKRPARVALQLALAYQIQKAIDSGKIRDQAEAARLLGLTRARVSQLLDLTLLAPDVQEKLLCLHESSSRPTREKAVRGAARRASWATQRTQLSE